MNNKATIATILAARWTGSAAILAAIPTMIFFGLVFVVGVTYVVLHSVLFWIAVLPVLIGGIGWIAWRITASDNSRGR